MYFSLALLTLCTAQVILAGDPFFPFHLFPESLSCRARTVEFRCRDKEIRWFYDRDDGDCRRFRGCPGRGNNFRSKDECEDRCEDRHNGCRRKICDDCERCVRGRCLPVVFPNFWCKGRIPLLQEIVKIIPAAPPVVVNLCQNINCGTCQLCQSGQCVNVNGCIPPDPCSGINCGKCQQCQAGQCVNVAGCTPPDPCFGINCGRCQQCDSGRGYASCVNVCFGNGYPNEPQVPVDSCAGVSCPECFVCSAGQCVEKYGCIAYGLGRCYGEQCGPCHACKGGWCAPRRNGFCELRSGAEGHEGVFGRAARFVDNQNNDD